MGSGGVHGAKRQHRGTAVPCRPARASPLCSDPGTRRLPGALCGVAVPALCRTGTPAPRAAASGQKAGVILLAPPPAAAQGAMGGDGAVPPPSALEPEPYMGGGLRSFDPAAAAAGRRYPAAVPAAARRTGDRSRPCPRGIRPAAKRRLRLGKSKFFQGQAPGGGSLPGA